MPPVAPDAIPLPAESGSLGLSLVKFNFERDHVSFYSQFAPILADWLIFFHETLRTKATENQCKCGYCQGIIMNMCKEEDRVWVMDLSYCELCMRYTCPDNSCVDNCPCTSVCSVCLLQCCQPYVDPHNSMCPKHSMIFHCNACHSQACHECDVGNICTNCTELYCSECSGVGVGDGAGDFCTNGDCFKYYCSEEECTGICRYCEVCDFLFCPDCITEHQQRNCSNENID